VFHNAEQVRTWVEQTWGVAYSISGLKDLLRRIGASYHKVSGFFWKADVGEQKPVGRKHRRHKRPGGAGDPAGISWTPATRSGAWTCSIPAGCWWARVLRGVGNGRKRLNILGAYCPDDHDYVNLRLTKEKHHRRAIRQAAGALRAKHPDTAKFILYLDNARTTASRV